MLTIRAMIALASLAAPLIALSAEPPAERVAIRVKALTRATKWTQVAAIPIAFRTFHPQGMVKIGDEFYVSSVEVRKLPQRLPTPVGGHAYDAGTGIGHLFKIGADGRLVADLIVGEGSIYHPGGIDYDGTSILVPVAEYRPDSRAIVYAVDPATMTARKLLSVADHIGGVIHDRASGRIEGVSWGSRRLYSWPFSKRNGFARVSTMRPIVNTNNYLDYQDCHSAGPRLMLCTGVAEYKAKPDGPAFQLGGIDLLDLATHRPVWQVPVPLWTPSGRAMTQNPFWIEATATGLRAYFMPDDDSSILFVFDTVIPGP